MSWALSAITGNPAVHFFRDHGQSIWESWAEIDGTDTYTKNDDSFADEEFFRYAFDKLMPGSASC